MTNFVRLQPGDFIGGFRLNEELPLSATAAWWLVSRAIGEPDLLMKIPRIERGARLINFAAFEVEKMILHRLSGPCVPRLIAAGTWDNPFLVLEVIPGESLCPQLSKLPLSAEIVANLGAKIATALHNIHLQHVIHLDIKPSNVMLDQSGKVTIIDFGFSRHLDLPDVFEDQFVGPRHYLAPEQLRGERTNPQSDIFSLGVMLYVFITGRQPFDALSATRKWRNLHRRARIQTELQKIPDLLPGFSVVKQIVSNLSYRANRNIIATRAELDIGNRFVPTLDRLYRKPIPPRVLAPDCPVWLQNLILRSLEIRPEERHDTAAQLAYDLMHPQQVHMKSREERLRRGRRSLR